MFLNENPIGWREWQNSQDRHKSKIKEIYSTTSVRIDNHLPDVLKRPTQSNPTTSIYGSAFNLREIERKNAKILDKLTKMARSPVVLKTMHLAENRVNKRKYFLKKLENGKLFHDNILLAQRLQKTTSSVNFKKYEEDFAKSKKYCMIRQKMRMNSKLSQINSLNKPI